MSLVRILIVLSGTMFLIYGVLCLSSISMVNDFQRFGMERLRIATGVFEVLGGVGQLVGLAWPLALWVASAGLALMMFIAFGVRIRMRDSVAESLPSLSLMLVNLYILIESLKA